MSECFGNAEGATIDDAEERRVGEIANPPGNPWGRAH